MTRYCVVILFFNIMVITLSVCNRQMHGSISGNFSVFDGYESFPYNKKFPNFHNKSGEKMSLFHLETGLLVKRLLNHTSIIGPRHNPLDPVTIRIHLQLQQVVKMDVDTQQMVLSGWLYQSWRDDSLSWNGELFRGKSVRLKPTDIWVPDVGFINTAENTQSLKPITILPVRVNWLGVVSWQQPILITTLCHMDVSFFPYDTQACTLSMMSFRKHGGLINLCHMQHIASAVSVAYFVVSGSTLRFIDETSTITSSYFRPLFCFASLSI
ncbi:acetylcholine receptor subunit alpha-like [Convolutriloba macropyga]|uniref:acetylcholine receptor subunit alpha-like n=1 Tax=Convolutriloba macropyga TaxID=536237 RepID=UPI003F525AFE